MFKVGKRLIFSNFTNNFNHYSSKNALCFIHKKSFGITPNDRHNDNMIMDELKKDNINKESDQNINIKQNGHNNHEDHHEEHHDDHHGHHEISGEVDLNRVYVPQNEHVIYYIKLNT